MTTLTTLQATSNLPALPVQDLAAARTYLGARISEATKRAYRTDWVAFLAYCQEVGAQALPAAPELVAAFLARAADSGLKYPTVSRRAAAINFAHLSAGFDSPTKTHLVSGMLQGIRRRVGVAPVKKTPATSRKIAEMVRLCPDTLQGKRDRALLLLGFAGAFRRSELVGLVVSDLVLEEAGLRVTIRRSKTDQEGQGQEIAIPRGEVFCPVAAVRDYLEAAGIAAGPVFRAVTRWGTLRDSALTAHSVAELVKAYAERAGFDPAAFAGHSLRSGFLTSAAEAGANIFKMAAQSRHKSIQTVQGYVRSAELFKNHAGAGLL